MTTYVVLGNFTQKGIETIKDLPSWREDVIEVLRDAGISMRENLYTLGKYDFVLIMEAPNEEVMMKALLSRARLGHIRTETLTAVSAEKMIEIVKGLP